MIKGFSNETSPLNDYELRVLLPVILAGLKDKQGKRNAVTNGYIIGRLKQQGYRIDAPRLRKVINHIRTNEPYTGLNSDFRRLLLSRRRTGAYGLRRQPKRTRGSYKGGSFGNSETKADVIHGSPTKSNTTNIKILIQHEKRIR